MEQENSTTTVKKFFLVGFTESAMLQYIIFTTFLIIYAMTWLGNVTIITTVITDQQLHKPMYFLLGNLAFIDLSESSVTLPKMLWDLLSEIKTISFQGCITQMFFFHFTGGAVAILLIVMALDRYVALHKPLQYQNIMNHNVLLGLVAGAWVGGFVHSIVQVALITQLPFCGPNFLDNFYCDVPQIIKLACTDIFVVELLMVSNSGLLTILIFIVLIVSYAVILVKIRTHITEGKHKAFSTCGAQLAVVSIHFVPCIFIYARPFQKLVVDKAMSSLYTVITPMLNPIIYTLRNTEMKNAISRLLNNIFFRMRNSQLSFLS
ncbi:olfactory receptor 4D1-like [Grus americana]|uniref:olfactory receptor 4D1-like n=1 Tax=Grus americana TaxID=9117 RepID=UPI002408022A|nr:olfactory receptor 4D1-like [Grus americana]